MEFAIDMAQYNKEQKLSFKENMNNEDYVIIQHANGESSFYGHMIMDSLTVKKGDKVKQGQIIGKVGHTGLSNCPHLHFQLMDKPNILTGRGLPCAFTNIKDVTEDPIDRITDDNIIVHTY